ncbi:MAG: glycerol-3-phosphate 1-O-acyltransferase PlsY [Myxococcota bacterium]
MYVLVVGAYLAGGLPFGVMIARALGHDIQESGSGNTGATNVGRVVGRAWGILVLILDAAKGAIPCWLALESAPAWAPAVGGAAIVGHVFSPFLGFRGGKGVATSAGVFAVLAPAALGAATVAFLAGLLIVRAVGFGSLLAAATLVGYVWWLPHSSGERALASAMAVLIFVRHIGNIRRRFRPVS